MKKKILFIIGSFREKSFHKTLAEEVKNIISNRADVEILDYKNVPLFNQDLEKEGNCEVTVAREKALNCDGIWVFSPEYNGKMPGILKNLLDWLSRSLDPKDSRGASAVHRKKVTITCTAGTPEAEKIRKDLSEVLSFMRMDLIYGNGVGITVPTETWNTGVLKINKEEILKIEKQVDEFLNSL